MYVVSLMEIHVWMCGTCSAMMPSMLRSSIGPSYSTISSLDGYPVWVM